MKILFACNDLDYFIAHRLFLAESTKARNHEVFIAVEETADETKIPELELIKLPLNRYRFSPIADIRLLWGYYRAIKQIEPDIIHAITIKPILVLSLVMLLVRWKNRPKLVLTFPGLGKIFEEQVGIYHSVRRSIVTNILKFCRSFNTPFATFENMENRDTMVEFEIISQDKTKVILGAGIEPQYVPGPRNNKLPIVLCAGRLLNAKGVGHFIAAAAELTDRGAIAEFQVAGEWDRDNPDSIDLEVIENAKRTGAIKFLGNIPGDQVHSILQQTDILCMPSMLKEGLPRIVIEAAACGCALLVSDQGSTHPFVKNGETGYRLKPVTCDQIVSDLERMLDDFAATRKMGENAARTANDLPIREPQIFDNFLMIYESELGRD